MCYKIPLLLCNIFFTKTVFKGNSTVLINIGKRPDVSFCLSQSRLQYDRAFTAIVMNSRPPTGFLMQSPALQNTAKQVIQIKTNRKQEVRSSFLTPFHQFHKRVENAIIVFLKFFIQKGISLVSNIFGISIEWDLNVSLLKRKW